MLRLENIFSLYDSRSAVGRLNREGSIKDPPLELREVVAHARRFSELTAGSFDITIQPLHDLLVARGTLVRADELERAAALVDYRAIAGNERVMRFSRPGMKITCNGIAQGYITDRVAALLRGRGFTHTLVDLGEKHALGGHPEGRPWNIGIESPAERGALAGFVALESRALATSGGYGNAFGHGKRHHLIDARTGTSRHDFASVSVLAPTATLADTLSTCLAVLPAASARRLLAGFSACEVFVIRKPGDRLERWPAGGMA
jgi:thiamine biosynthesis lipoprotein